MFSLSFSKILCVSFLKGVLDSVAQMKSTSLPPCKGVFPGTLYSLDKEKAGCFLHKLFPSQPQLARMIGTALWRISLARTLASANMTFKEEVVMKCIWLWKKKSYQECAKLITHPEIQKRGRDTYLLVFSDIVYYCPCLIIGWEEKEES